MSFCLKSCVIENIEKLIKAKEDLKKTYLTINLNEECNQELKKDSQNISFKINNYRKWLRIINSLTSDDFSTFDSLKTKIKSKSLLSKINEIIKTKKLKELELTVEKIKNLESNNLDTYKTKKLDKNKDYFKNSKKESKYRDIDIKNLQRVNGIGETTAKKFLDKGIKLEHFLEEWDTYFKPLKHQIVPDEYINLDKNTSSVYLSNIRQNFIKAKFQNTKYLKLLNYSQIVGIKYFHDIEKRIPRDEIKKMGIIINQSISRIQKDIIVEICGSYRRGNKDSGDIDILLTHPLIKEKSDFSKIKGNILLELIRFLTRIGFLLEHITVDGNTKYMGVCKLKSNSNYRRIDIRFIAYNSYPSALLYFTGNANLNKIMRVEAIKKGYRLNEYGLYKLEYDKKSGSDVLGEKIITNTEEDIFKALDMTYLKPTERNVK